MQQTLLHCLETRGPFDKFQLHKHKGKKTKNDLNEKTRKFYGSLFRLFLNFYVLCLEEIAVLAVLLAVSLDLTLSLVLFFLKGNITTNFDILLQIL